MHRAFIKGVGKRNRDTGIFGTDLEGIAGEGRTFNTEKIVKCGKLVLCKEIV